jgi:hypothetical protein
VTTSPRRSTHLVLAYAGSALPVPLFGLSGRSVHDRVTGDEIAGELVRGMIGGDNRYQVEREVTPRSTNRPFRSSGRRIW